MDVPASRSAPRAIHAERPITTWNGFLMLGVGLAFFLAAIWQLISMVGAGRPTLGAIGLVVLWFVLGVLVLSGLYTLQPNTGAILQLFGDYRGTSRVPGLRFTNPFYSNKKLSLRARNLTGERLKVNDKRGNPIEIAAVVVWHVDDTARAVFEVDDYENFVKVQSEAAVRHLASSFAYDEDDTSGEPAGPTLLGSADVVA
ncbi:MAG TPA: SPFH domain-containing protein, partial [Casimicrobiaceae bacterium]